MKNVLKTITFLLIITNLSCISMLKTQGTSWGFDLKANESILIGDIQGKDLSISPGWNSNEKVDYLSKNENIIIKNNSNKDLLFTSQINGQNSQQNRAKYKTITVTLAKGRVFTLHNGNTENKSISIKFPAGFNFKYKRITEPKL